MSQPETTTAAPLHWQEVTYQQLHQWYVVEKLTLTAIVAKFTGIHTPGLAAGRLRKLGLMPRADAPPTLSSYWTPPMPPSLPTAHPLPPQPLPEPTPVSHPPSSPAKLSPAFAKVLAARRPLRTHDIPDDTNDPDDGFCKGQVKAGPVGGWIRCQAAANKRTGYCDICGPKYRDC